MREKDEIQHAKAVERKIKATQRLVMSSLIALAGLVLVFRGEPLVGFAAAFLASGILSAADLKTFMGK
jgi:hypothetical protein